MGARPAVTLAASSWPSWSSAILTTSSELFQAEELQTVLFSSKYQIQRGNNYPRLELSPVP